MELHLLRGAILGQDAPTLVVVRCKPDAQNEVTRAGHVVVARECRGVKLEIQRRRLHLCLPLHHVQQQLDPSLAVVMRLWSEVHSKLVAVLVVFVHDGFSAVVQLVPRLHRDLGVLKSSSTGTGTGKRSEVK